jgi:DNA-binding NtrC family response regulator
MRRLLVIDLNSGAGKVIQQWFDSAEVEVAYAQSAEAGWKLLGEIDPEALVCCLDRPGEPANECINQARRIDPKVPVVLTYWSDTAGGHDARAPAGAFDVLTSPIDESELKHRVRVAGQAGQIAKSPITTGAYSAPGQEALMGRSAPMGAVFGALERLAFSDAAVLISGEPGTGKNLVARAIHQQSRRGEHFLVTLDCGTRPGTLERELFTPGQGSWRGRLEPIALGTILLDRIERLPVGLQGKLVEAVRAQAAEQAVPPDRPAARIISTTTAVLKDAVAARTFREDLFDLLSVVRIELPPLRSRGEDVPDLAAYFLGRFAQSRGERAKSLSLAVSRLLNHYSWPGNVRELEELIGRGASFARGEAVQLGDLPADFLNAVAPILLPSTNSRRIAAASNGTNGSDVAALSRMLFDWARRDSQFRVIPAMERELIIHAMAETGGNQVQAARLLGITRATLRKRLLRFNIQKEVLIR